MKYTYINIRNFIRKEPVLFSLVLVCIITSSIVTYFFFGLYHHLEQKRLDEQSGTRYIEAGFNEKDFGDNQSGTAVMQDGSSTKFYDTLTVFCLLLMGISGTVLMMLFEYILLKRKRQLAIYRLCGLTPCRVRLLYFTECFLVTAFSYLIAFVLFHFGIQPAISEVFEYISASYTPKTYGILGLLYAAGASVLLYPLIWKRTKTSVMQGIK